MGRYLDQGDGAILVDEWAKVDKRICLIGIFPAVPILIAGITVIFLTILGFWFIGTLPGRVRARLKQ